MFSLIAVMYVYNHLDLYTFGPAWGKQVVSHRRHVLMRIEMMRIRADSWLLYWILLYYGNL